MTTALGPRALSMVTRSNDVAPRLCDGGRAIFDEVVRSTDRARSAIDIRAFVWRDDDTGNQLASALLRAADKGVKISIRKDRMGAVYEHSSGSKQSFFHKRPGVACRTQAWFLRMAYGNHGTAPQRPNPVAEALVRHPNVEVEHTASRFDHAKLFVVDDEKLVLGSMGIGDDHRLRWVEVGVTLEGKHHVERLRQRLAGEVPFDRSRPVDFLVHSRTPFTPPARPMAEARLELINGAQRSLIVAMAYLGDPRFTGALERAVDRGVDVTLLTAAKADVLGDLNRAICERIRRRAGASAHLKIFLHPRMVHAKAVIVDGRWSDVGSANFTPLSHGIYEEVNAVLNDSRFACELAASIERHCREAELVGAPIPQRFFHGHAERAILTYLGRRRC